MDFDFSDEQKQLRDQARRFLQARCPPGRVRRVLDGHEAYDSALWRGLADLGYLGVSIPDFYGGTGAGPVELCIVAEELGRALAPIPALSSIFLAAECVMAAGTEDQKRRLLPELAAGRAIGCLAIPEDSGQAGVLPLTATGGFLHGTLVAVLDGGIADFAIVAARDAGPAMSGGSLFLVTLRGEGVRRSPVATLDPSRGHARLTFDAAPAEPLGAPGTGAAILSRVLDRAAVLVAFEQLGGAEKSLEAARDYALERHAFGRAIGSFQAIKHMLADMYVSAALARSNCYYGAWALSTDAAELPLAAATARVSATQAFRHCAGNALQIHGAMGFTWEADCHLYYRRAALLALALGSPSHWSDRLVEHLDLREAA